MNLGFAPNRARLAEIRSLARTATPNPSIGTGLTIMEAVAYVAGQPRSEAPTCTSPLLAAFVSNWAEALDDVERNALLLPLVPGLVGAHRVSGSYFGHLALVWLLRDALPAWLRVAGFDEAGKFETGKFETGLPAPVTPAAIAAWTDELGALGRLIPDVLCEDFADKLGAAEIFRQVVPRLRSTGDTAAADVVEEMHGPNSPLTELADRAVTLCHVSACLGCAKAAKAAVAAARGRDEELAASAAVMTTYDRPRAERQASALRLVRRMIERV